MLLSSFFFLIIDLYFLIPTVTLRELAIRTRTPNNEGNAKIETHPLTGETKTRKFSK